MHVGFAGANTEVTLRACASIFGGAKGIWWRTLELEDDLFIEASTGLVQHHLHNLCLDILRDLLLGVFPACAIIKRGRGTSAQRSVRARSGTISAGSGHAPFLEPRVQLSVVASENNLRGGRSLVWGDAAGNCVTRKGHGPRGGTSALGKSRSRGSPRC